MKFPKFLVQLEGEHHVDPCVNAFSIPNVNWIGNAKKPSFVSTWVLRSVMLVFIRSVSGTSTTDRPRKIADTMLASEFDKLVVIFVIWKEMSR